MGFPESLNKTLYNKLRHDDFDLGENVQMVLDEDNEALYVRALKDLEANSDVFLIDHAWTFKQRTAYPTLLENEKLRERMTNLMKFSDKLDLPGESPYEKKRKPLQEYMIELEERDEPALIYDLDSYDIKTLKEFKFRPEVEEISLWDNEIMDPNDVTKVLMTLPNLKALWLNNNPVVASCSNFNIIGNIFDKLEIINSNLTQKAGEWAMLFYARDSGAQTLADIQKLDLSGKNLLVVDDLSFVG